MHRENILNVHLHRSIEVPVQSGNAQAVFCNLMMLKSQRVESPFPVLDGLVVVPLYTGKKSRKNKKEKVHKQIKKKKIKKSGEKKSALKFWREEEKEAEI